MLLFGNLCVHGVGLFAETSDFQLQHLVLRDGAYLVSALGHAVERVGIGIVVVCCYHIALCRGQVEEVVACAGRHQFYGLGIVLLCLGVAQRLYAAVPFQRVVAEEALLVAYAHGNGTEHVGLALQFAEVVDTALYEERAARPTDVLVDAQCQVGGELALSQEAGCAVALGDLVYLIIYIRR